MATATMLKLSSVRQQTGCIGVA